MHLRVCSQWRRCQWQQDQVHLAFFLTLFNSWTSPFKVCFWRFFDLHQNQTGINGCSSPGSLSSSFHYSLRSKSLVMESGCLFFSATPIWRSVTFCGHGWLEEEQMVWDQLSETETRQRDEKFASKESYDLLLSCEICWMIVTMNCKRSTKTHMVGKVRWYCKDIFREEKKPKSVGLLSMRICFPTSAYLPFTRSFQRFLAEKESHGVRRRHSRWHHNALTPDDIRCI